MTHQHVTKKHRTKRADTRPNAKQRLRALQREEAQKTAQDIRVVKTRRVDRKERQIAPLHESLKPELSDDDKMIRNLRKKLRSIDELIERQKQGVALNPEQVAKIEQLDTALAAFEELIRKKHGSDVDAIAQAMATQKPSARAE
jgi:uncharacterized protein with WD repeat